MGLGSSRADITHHNAMECNTPQPHATTQPQSKGNQCNPTQCNGAQHNETQPHKKQHNPMKPSTTQPNPVKPNAVQPNPMENNPTLSRAMVLSAT